MLSTNDLPPAHNNAYRYMGVCIATAVLMLLAPARTRAETAKEIYSDACESCHGPTGKGDGPAGLALQPHPADLSEALRDKRDDWIAKVITQGGESVGLPPTMPSFGQALDPEQVKSLVQYIRAFGSQHPAAR
jgi:high-affinity iron transporter